MGARSLVVLDCAFPGHLSEPPDTLTEALLFSDGHHAVAGGV